MWWILAFDHRNSLRCSFFGVTGAATAADHARARETKAVIFDGVVRAIELGIPSGRPAVLVDEEYGADVIRRARELGVPVVVPVEASGLDVVRFEHGDDGFGPALERVDPEYAKVLVRYNPEGANNDNRVQRERLALLQRWVRDHGRKWMLELLVPATPEQLAACGGESGRYDGELRPGLTVRAAAELRDSGLEPELWKLEGMATSAEFAAIAAACGAAGPGRGRAETGETVGCMCSAAAPTRPPSIAGCRWRRRSPGFTASRSAGRSGGTRCAPPSTVRSAATRRPSGSPATTSA